MSREKKGKIVKTRIVLPFKFMIVIFFNGLFFKMLCNINFIIVMAYNIQLITSYRQINSYKTSGSSPCPWKIWCQDDFK